MKTGLFFGSFNPIHTGHLIIANTVLNAISFDKIWFVVSPQNPFKKDSELLAAEKRLELVQASVAEDSRLLASNVEFFLPVPSYTIATLQHLEKKYPENSFYLIMGSDSFLQLPQWKNYKNLIQKKLIVYLRPGYDLDKISTPDNVTVLESPLLNISATEIRALIKAGKSIKYLVAQKAIQLIESQSLYK